jgi:hypothetical protein
MSLVRDYRNYQSQQVELLVLVLMLLAQHYVRAQQNQRLRMIG